MTDKIKVGIMFCGGCNVYYERRDAYDAICNAHQNRAEFIPSSYLTDQIFDMVIIINGCPSVCMFDIDFHAPTLVINNTNQEVAAQVVGDKLDELFGKQN